MNLEGKKIAIGSIYECFHNDEIGQADQIAKLITMFDQYNTITGELRPA